MTKTDRAGAGIVLGWVRKALGHTQDEVGTALGITKQAVSRIETSQTSLSLEHLQRAAGAFGLLESDLLDLVRKGEEWLSLADQARDRAAQQSKIESLERPHLNANPDPAGVIDDVLRTRGLKGTQNGK